MADDGIAIYDEVEIEDMTYDETLQIFHYPCPCGDRFEIAIQDLQDGENIAVCPSCSLMIRVIFDVVGFLPPRRLESVGKDKGLTASRIICPSHRSRRPKRRLSLRRWFSYSVCGWIIDRTMAALAMRRAQAGRGPSSYSRHDGGLLGDPSSHDDKQRRIPHLPFRNMVDTGQILPIYTTPPQRPYIQLCVRRPTIASSIRNHYHRSGGEQTKRNTKALSKLCLQIK
jgi:diphthamide biosynthesis protein 3